MIRTIPLKLCLVDESPLLKNLQNAFGEACNFIVPYAIENRCWNRVALHKLVYDKLRSDCKLGSQMTCNAIFAVCKAYKSLQSLKKITPKKPIPKLSFKKSSVHFDKRTYSFTKSGHLTLYTLEGRIKVPYQLGDQQKKWLALGKAKEAELVFKRGVWYLNLCIEVPTPLKLEKKGIMGIDVGENNLAATSTGKIFGGQALRDKRDRFLANRCRLQSNGTQSAKQKLCKISGKERRHVKHINHEISAAIIKEAQQKDISLIILEDLTNIRERIRAKKRERSRLHRWPFRELQQYIYYKAENAGIEVKYVCPAYTSKICSNCCDTGIRIKHQFKCNSCGLLAHADCNASRNLAKIAVSADIAKARVNWPNVGIA